METNCAERVLELISEATGRPVGDITILDRLEEFDMDSLEFVELMQEVSKIKTVSENKWHTFDTVGDLVRAVE